ncbi:MAG: hypothetical protein MUO42_00445 [Anaerolineaceae bacterium]|nr:hypothetical protein [Anaerolineaceae bacterium]
MKKQVGLWINHRKAVIVTVTDKGEETKQIASEMEKHIRFSSGESEKGSTEDMRDRQFGNHLISFYDDVIACLRDAETIQIFDPGEAKGELETRLETSLPAEPSGLLYSPWALANEGEPSISEKP